MRPASDKSGAFALDNEVGHPVACLVPGNTLFGYHRFHALAEARKAIEFNHIHGFIKVERDLVAHPAGKLAHAMDAALKGLFQIAAGDALADLERNFRLVLKPRGGCVPVAIAKLMGNRLQCLCVADTLAPAGRFGPDLSRTGLGLRSRHDRV